MMGTTDITRVRWQPGDYMFDVCDRFLHHLAHLLRCYNQTGIRHFVAARELASFSLT